MRRSGEKNPVKLSRLGYTLTVLDWTPTVYTSMKLGTGRGSKGEEKKGEPPL